ncbi:MAG: helix-turn-helix transcriptional regulator [Alphaproteobacteria bacterium]|nr:helix-turn-helix transcriptional regulator [Alphaproteobacteria bacterium]
MTVGQELEFIRKKSGVSILEICNALNVSESEYRNICSDAINPTIYQLIMFVFVCRRALSFV